MERVTFRLPTAHIEEVDELVEAGEYPNRSEALRSFIRDGLKDQEKPKQAARQPWKRP